MKPNPTAFSRHRNMRQGRAPMNMSMSVSHSVKTGEMAQPAPAAATPKLSSGRSTFSSWLGAVLPSPDAVTAHQHASANP